MLYRVQSFRLNRYPLGWGITFTLENGKTIRAEGFLSEYRARDYASLFCNLRHSGD